MFYFDSTINRNDSVTIMRIEKRVVSCLTEEGVKYFIQVRAIGSPVWNTFLQFNNYRNAKEQFKIMFGNEE